MPMKEGKRKTEEKDAEQVKFLMEQIWSGNLKPRVL